MEKADIINKVYQLELSKRATLVVFYLINRANNELTCFPCIKTIARECNMSARTVQRALGDLEEVGLVRKESRFYEQGGQRSNLYYLQIPEDEVNNKIDEVSFETYQEDEIVEEVDKNINVMDIQSLKSESLVEVNEVQICSIYFSDQSVEPSMSWGDSHYDVP